MNITTFLSVNNGNLGAIAHMIFKLVNHVSTVEALWTELRGVTLVDSLVQPHKLVATHGK